MPTGDRRAPLPGLTALRFFAASYVLLFHLFPLSPAAAAHPNLPQRLISAGFTGVSCFFVLSGFILAYAHPTVPKPGSFFRARFARIYPLYLFAFLISLPSFLHAILRFGPRFQLWAIPADLLLLQSWIPTLAFAINSPAWTLSCEALFYVLFPFLITQRWLRICHPLRLILLIWIAELIPPAVTQFWLLPHLPQLTAAAFSVLFLPVFRLGEFLAGMVLGLMFLERQHPAQHHPAQQSPFWLLPVSLALCVTFLSFNLLVPHTVVRNGLLLGPYCLLIWALATRPNRFLASRPMQLGGEISYGVYLLQVPLTRWLHVLLERTPWGIALPGSVLLAVYPFAWLTYTTVEKPCRKWLLGLPLRSPSRPIPTPQPELP